MKNNSIFYEDVSLDDYESLREASNAALNRIIRSMDNFSYVIISSDRHELLKEENLKRFSKLKKIVKNADFGYIPVKGGYLEDGTIPVIENFIIIFNIGRDRNVHSSEELFDLGLKLCKYDLIQQDIKGNFIGDDPADVESFGQDSFLFKDENSPPTYYDKNGNKVSELSNNLKFNNKLEKYFTSLVKGDKRFTFKEVFIPRYPMSNSGFIVRYLQGELI